MLKRRTVDNSKEEIIVTGFIVDDTLLRTFEKMVKPKWFKSDYAKIVIKWCLEYYKTTREAPKEHIEQIFMVKREELSEEQEQLVEEFLVKLSGLWDRKKQNTEYLVELTKEYLRIRSASELSERIQANIVAGKDSNEIVKIISEFKDVLIETSSFIDVTDKEEIHKTLENYVKEEDEDREEFLFKFPHAFGRYMKAVEREQLIGVVAPMKRGKSFLLQEFALQGIMSGLNVVMFNLEMDKERVKQRLYKRILSKGRKETIERFPVFDCQYNLKNKCPLDYPNSIDTPLVGELIPLFENYKNSYKPCTKCRGMHNSPYLMSTWFEEIKIEAVTKKDITFIDNFFFSTKSQFVLKCYPMGMANVSRIKADLDELQYDRGFIPDVVVIDYADILAPEQGRKDKIEEVNDTWVWLKSLTNERHCNVTTATQTNRGGIKKQSVEQDDTGENIKKIAHVDLMIALNQTIEEKECGVIRAAKIAGRYQDFSQNIQCALLQQLDMSQGLLDSEIIRLGGK
jgi:replicative DNA helicase